MPTEGVSRPMYTVMVPLYRESAALPGLLSALDALDYPRDKLEIFLLVEADDLETSTALITLNLPRNVRVIQVPPGTPRTKPRALNVGLELARGELITVFDAEDRPDRSQLIAAAEAFAHGSERLACVQAPLTAYNASESWIAGHWALEYLIQFRLLLPALARLGLPVPLGGTSNHFRADVLKSVGGWDAWNVTEDADLGLRLARNGHSVGTISPGTLEEAPIRLGAWTAQRSRWIKGHAQSWLVFARDPVEACRGTGMIGFLAATALMLGGVLAALVHGFAAMWLIATIALPAAGLPAVDAGLILAGLSVNALAGLLALRHTRHRLVLSVLTQPLYWPLHTFAAVRALYGLCDAPHFWAKTRHGVTRQTDPVNSLALTP